MHTIGVRELKAQLSRVLRDVRGGARYLVTDRGRVVAELRAPEAGADLNLSSTDQARLRMAAAGELRIGERIAPTYGRSSVSLPDGTAQEWLDWARGEE